MTIRRAVAADARGAGEVFDAAVSAGWKYPGELVSKPMFPAEEWEKVVAEHAPPNALFVMVDHSDQIAGFTAPYAQRAAASRSSTLTNRTKGRWRFTKLLDTGATVQFANRTFEASTCANPG